MRDNDVQRLELQMPEQEQSLTRANFLKQRGQVQFILMLKERGFVVEDMSRHGRFLLPQWVAA